MKKILLSINALLLGVISFAQTTFTDANEPSIGDTRTMYVVDSNAVNYAGTTGSGVTWNYGTSPTYAGQTKSLSVVDATTTTYASDFPGATKAIVLDNFITTYMSSSSTERLSQGFLVEIPQLGEVKVKFDTDAEQLMSYPMALNGVVNDVFSGNLEFTYNSQTITPNCSGVSVAKYDGYGTFIQVNNISVPNVARFHIMDSTTATIPLFGTVKIIRSQYEYYDLAASNKTPIFIHAHVVAQSGFPTPLGETTVVLSGVQGNQVAGLNENNTAPFVLYPNPAKDELIISNLATNAVVTIVDLAGRATTLANNGSNNFDISNFAEGVYIVKIETEGQIYTEQLIKE